MFPDLPKLGLFGRQARPGWDVWGNETGKFGDAAWSPGPASSSTANASTGLTSNILQFLEKTRANSTRGSHAPIQSSRADPRDASASIGLMSTRTVLQFPAKRQSQFYSWQFYLRRAAQPTACRQTLRS